MSKDTNSPPRNGFRLLLFAFGSIYSLFCSLFLTAYIYRYKFESLDIASSIAATGAFANPYQTLATGPTAHLPPLYPAFLSIFFWVFKNQLFYNYLSLSVVTAVLYGIAAAFLPTLGNAVLKNRGAGVLAGCVIVTLPVVQVLPSWEVVPLFLCLMIFCYISLSAAPRAWLLGVLGAIASLLNVPAVLFLATWSIGLTVLKKWRPRTLGVALAVCFGLCLPWMIRNYLVIGSFCIRDTFGLELQVSNNDHAQPFMSDNIETAHVLYHPNLSRPQAVLVKQIGEVEYNRRKLNEALAWIKTNPSKFATLTAEHFLFFWFPDRRLAFGPVIWLVTLLSIPASISALRTSTPRSVLLIALIAFSLPYMVVQSDLRYRTPTLWITALFAGQSVQMLLGWLSRYRGGVLSAAPCDSTVPSGILES